MEELTTAVLALLEPSTGLFVALIGLAALVRLITAVVGWMAGRTE